MKARFLALIAAVLVLQGCASIVNGGRQEVSVLSEPAGASYAITGPEGTVAQGVTPAVERLQSGAGFFKRAEYVVTYRKEGYADRRVAVAPKVSGWYWVGACVSLVGALIVDPLTGGMFKLPEQVKATLRPNGVASNGR